MRRTERLPVELNVLWNRAGRDIPCTAVDVNAHGLFVRTDEVVEPESLMHLKVTLSDRVLEMFVTARFIGKTVSGHGIGVEIFLIDDSQPVPLARLLRGAVRRARAHPQVGGDGSVTTMGARDGKMAVVGELALARQSHDAVVARHPRSLGRFVSCDTRKTWPESCKVGRA